MLGLAGCEPPPPVKEQNARRLNETQRCLGAVVFPEGEKSSKIWVFRAIGPEHPLDQFRPTFDNFFQHNITFNDRREVEWKLPADWKEVKRPKNAVTFQANVKDLKEPLEITVHQRTMRRQIMDRPDDPHAPKAAALGNFMKRDVERRTNNWRRELGLTSIGAESWYFYHAARLGPEGWLFLVNMTGPGHETLGFTELQFDLPKGWDEVLPKAAPGIPPAKLAIRVQDNAKKASFTLNTGIRGGIHDNVNRWWRQVNKFNKNFKELDEKEIDAMLKDIPVAGLTGKYVDLQGPRPEEKPGQPPKEFDNRTLGVILTTPDDEMWFFKLTGPDDLIEQQIENFKEFVKNFAFAQ